jgi:cysteinyl-tRNA synthetase
MVEGSKMSKSAGNFYTARELMNRGWTGRELRYTLLAVHYRIPLNFTMEGLEASRQALARVDAWAERLQEFASADTPEKPLEKLGSIQLGNFFNALDDDLNISAALAVLFEIIRESNRLLDTGKLPPTEAAGLLQWWKKANEVLALESEISATLPDEVSALLAARQAAREAKDWTESDRLRDEIAALGWQIKDTKGEQKVQKRN